jgi:tetratricopeptide (TPR) repeat protein
MLTLIGGSIHLLWQSSRKRPFGPLFSGLGAHSRKITTSSPIAQKYFNQGLNFLYGFKPEEASRSFQATAESDPQCPMAYWGIAMANGPNINNMAVSVAHVEAACKAIAKARELSPGATPVEQALIEAVSERFVDPQPANRKSLNQAYADAMRNVWKTFPNDGDVGALTAEALIDLKPWNQWTRDGKPQPGTEELLQTLDAVLARSPMHPFALHLYIHALEASPFPERADFAAERLRDLAPGLEHLLHMPSHIDVRRGRWQKAVVANEKAIAAEIAYRKIVTSPDPYQIPMAHNHHTLMFAAMMQGESGKATRAAQDLLAAIPEEYIKKRARLIDGFFAMPYEIHLRFGRWNAMLAEPEPRACFPITMALWHYARGVALAAKKQVEPAKLEQREFLAAKAVVPKNSFFRKTPAATYLAIAEKMLDGEVLYREGKVDDAVAALREAVDREDDLHYTEPANWILPVRHALGATLMDAGRYAQAFPAFASSAPAHRATTRFLGSARGPDDRPSQATKADDRLVR